MDDATTVGKIEARQQLQHEDFYGASCQVRVHDSEVLVLHILEYQGWSDIWRITHLVVESNSVLALLDGSQAHNLTPHFFLLHWLEHFDNYTFVSQ